MVLIVLIIQKTLFFVITVTFGIYSDIFDRILSLSFFISLKFKFSFEFILLTINTYSYDV